ncbi:MAG: hypothetical protein V3U82_05230 [Robiginitomaculum sp.]
MTYSTQDLDALHTGEAVFVNAVSAPVRNTRRRRHAHIMSHHAAGARISGFGI